MVSQRAKKLHFSSILVDTHIDTIDRVVDKGEDLGTETGKGHVDLPRMKAGNMTAAFFSCYVSSTLVPQGKCAHRALQLIDAVKELCACYPNEIEVALTAADIRRIAAAGKRAAVICIEGGHAIEDDLRVLRQFYDLGVRYLTLTHFNTNNWADASMDAPRHNGLTDFGRQVVREMNRIGMIVDISHVSDKTFWDVMEVTTKPVMASHSSSWEICHHPRDMKDDMLRAVAKNGGVVCVNFFPAFLTEQYRLAWDDLRRRKQEETLQLENRSRFADAGSFISTPEWLAQAKKELDVKYEKLLAEIPLPTISDVLDHIDHIARVAGKDHVGLGSDMDGMPCIPTGIEDCSKYPAITDGLLKRGYSEGDVRKILGENVLRVMEAVIGA